MKLFILILFTVAYQTTKLQISITSLTTGKETMTSSYLKLDSNSDSAAVSNENYEFDSNDLLQQLNKQGPGNYSVEFKNNQQTYRTLVKMNNEDKIQHLRIELVTDSREQILSVFILKDYDTKRSTIVDKVQKQKVVNLVEEQMKQNFDANFARENLQQENFQNQDQQNQQQPQEPEKEKTFFQKYFWYIMVGGFIVMQVMNFDKQKLQQAMQEAQQQANQRQQQQNAPRR